MASSEEESTMSVETQLALLRERIDRLLAQNETRGADHETRLRRLEERRFPLQTMAVLTSLAAFLAAVAGILLGQ